MTSVIRVLIVDDDEEDRELFCEAVAQLAPRVECQQAIDGEDALALLTAEACKPDYIFLDLNMPRINGVQFLKKLKKYEALRDIPVVIYTTSKRAEDKEETRRLGAIHFISKPETLTELRAQITFVLDKKWAQVTH